MPDVPWRPHPRFAHVALCDSPEGLAAIREPHISLVIWERAVPTSLLAQLAAAPWEELAGLVRDGARAPWERWFNYTLWNLAESVSRGVGQPRECFMVERRPQNRNDGSERFDVQLFHIDGVAWRAVVQFLGAPFEWLPWEAPVREFLFRYSSAPASERTHRRYAAPARWVQPLPLGGLALFRGDAGGTADGGLKHRAPYHFASGPRFTAAITCHRAGVG